MSDINNPFGLETIDYQDKKYVEYEIVKEVIRNVEDKNVFEVLSVNEKLNIENESLKADIVINDKKLKNTANLNEALIKENKRLKLTLDKNSIPYESYKLSVLLNNGETIEMYYLTKEEINKYYIDNMSEIESFSFEKTVY